MTLSTIILALSTAWAGPFTAKTMQGEMPLAVTEREMVLPKGWLAIGVAREHKTSVFYRDEEGVLQPRSGGSAWNYDRTWLRVEQGFSPRITLYAHIPMVTASLTNDGGTATTTRALGDVHTGLRVQPLLGQRTKLGFGIDLKAPSGVEWPSDFIGGFNNTASFLTGTGITNLGLDIRWKTQQVQHLSFEGRLGYVQKFAGVVGYIVETDGFGNGWLNPGDEFFLNSQLTGQVSERLSTHLEIHMSSRGSHRIGVSGASPSQVELKTLQGTEARYLDLGWGFQTTLNQNLEVRVAAMGQVRGTDTRTFAHLGLEEFSPQPGVTSEIEVEYRW